MRLPDSFLEELRARTPLAALIGRRVKLSRSGRQWKGCCPFHGEKTPSFYVYDDGYHCFGCGAHGDAIGFVMQSQGASFMEAVEVLAGEAGLDVPKPSEAAEAAERVRLDLHGILQAAAELYQANLFAPQGAAGLAYLRGRGLTDVTIRKFGLGWSGEGRGALAQQLARNDVTPARLMEAGLLRPGDDGAPRGELFYNRVMFPIRDRRGRVISFGGRMLGDGQPKYVNGPETPVFSKRRTLYNLDQAREAARNGAPVVAVEGYMDVIALHQAGFGGAVAPLGTALTAEQLDLLWQLSPAPTLCFDGDSAGARAASRAADVALPLLAPDRTIRIATLPAGEDPDTLVRKRGAAGFKSILDSARPLSDALFDLVRESALGSATNPNPHERARFLDRLLQAASTIGHSSLSAEYKRDLRAKYYEVGRSGVSGRSWDAGRRAQKPVARAAKFVRPTPSVENAKAECVRALTAILLHHPSLILQFEEEYAGLTLPPVAMGLRDELLSYAEHTDSLDFDGLIAHLTGLRFEAALSWALSNEPLPLPSGASTQVTVGEAADEWRHFFERLRGSNLDEDVAASERESVATGSAAASQQHVAISTERFAWRRGETGSDSGSDE